MSPRCGSITPAAPQSQRYDGHRRNRRYLHHARRVRRFRTTSTGPRTPWARSRRPISTAWAGRPTSGWGLTKQNLTEVESEQYDNNGVGDGDLTTDQPVHERRTSNQHVTPSYSRLAGSPRGAEQRPADRPTTRWTTWAKSRSPTFTTATLSDRTFAWARTASPNRRPTRRPSAPRPRRLRQPGPGLRNATFSASIRSTARSPAASGDRHLPRRPRRRGGDAVPPAAW